MLSHFIILEMLLIGAMFNAFVGSNTVYKTVSMQCSTNPVYIENTECRLKALNRYKAVSNMECDIVKPLRNISLHLELFWKNGANFYRPFLVNVTNNLCNILDKRNFAAYGMIVKNILSVTSNVNHSCPYTGRLIAKNLYVDEKFMPIALPTGLYKFNFHFLEGYPYENIGTVILNVQIIEKQDLRSRTKREQTNFLG